MELKEATEFLEKFNDAVTTLKSKVSYLTSANTRLSKIETKYKELVLKDKGARKERRNNEMLAKYSTVKICDYCDGDGGFDAGEHSDECSVCKGSGVIESN